ncbi:hypothetical protein SDC9_64123 [bioreactor metagenome]|uniref:Siphovirus Gp157 family protein n=1 Tax=bioreactor metagenome TaxID=1076179 RepID=A0A644XNL0_9ZZZZ|nr:siphovirus Gp157 family protein [Acidaminococcaceae bacterium]
MAKLYELQSTFNQVLELMDDHDTDLDALESVLKSVEGEFEQKIEGCVLMIKNLEAEIEPIKAEAERLAARKKTLENKMVWMKNYMLVQMTLLEKDKIKTPNGLFTVARQKSPTSVIVHNMAEIPDKYFTVIPAQKQLDKFGVKDALVGGESVPGCELQQGYHIRIR